MINFKNIFSIAFYKSFYFQFSFCGCIFFQSTFFFTFSFIYLFSYWCENEDWHLTGHVDIFILFLRMANHQIINIILVAIQSNEKIMKNLIYVLKNPYFSVSTANTKVILLEIGTVIRSMAIVMVNIFKNPPSSSNMWIPRLLETVPWPCMLTSKDCCPWYETLLAPVGRIMVTAAAFLFSESNERQISPLMFSATYALTLVLPS